MHTADGNALTVIDGVVRYQAPEARCTAGALRRAMAELGPSMTVLFAPHGAPVRPVTDAVKRVRDGRLVGTVDRTHLRYLDGATQVARATLDALLAATPDDDTLVRPLA